MLRKRREIEGAAAATPAAATSSASSSAASASSRPKHWRTAADSAEHVGALGDGDDNALERSVFAGMKRAHGGAAADDDHSDIDVDGDSEDEGEETVGASSKGKGKGKGGKAKAKAPAWQDEDDQTVNVNVAAVARLRKLRQTEKDEVLPGDLYAERLRNQFENIHGKQTWMNSRAAEGEEPGLMQSSAKLLGKSRRRLPQGRLEVTRVTDANQQSRADAVVQACSFHPSAPALLVGGLDKTLKIFHVDGKDNSMLQSVFMRDMPIYAAQWSHFGEEIVIAGRRKFFYTFDIANASVRKVHEIQGRTEKSLERFWISPDDKHIVFTGHDGALVLLSNKTKQWVADLKMNGSARAVAFTPDSKHMLSTGGDGAVYVWDMTTRDCVHKFVDEGSIEGTVLAVSPDGSRFACGSSSGVVNLYDESCLVKEQPAPLKAIMNLTTSIDRLSFNHDSQVLALSSKLKKSAFRMLHVPSATVFSNWPTARTPINYVNSMAFSPHSEFLAMGNDKGKVLLYKLNHYSM